MARPRTILLDAGGVLVLPDPAAVREMLAPYGAKPDDDTCRQAHYFTMRELEREREPVPRWASIDRTYARIVGVAPERMDDAVVAIAGLYTGSAWVEAPDAIDLLCRLHDLGLATVIVSNAYGTMADILCAAGICSLDGSIGQRVAGILDSQVLGLEKPDPAIFLHAARSVRSEPHECVHLGDTVLLDVRGAQAAGMVGIHFDPYDLCPDSDHPHVARLTDMADLVVALT